MKIKTTVKSGAMWNHCESTPKGLVVKSTVKSGAMWNHCESVAR